MPKTRPVSDYRIKPHYCTTLSLTFRFRPYFGVRRIPRCCGAGAVKREFGKFRGGRASVLSWPTKDWLPKKVFRFAIERAKSNVTMSLKIRHRAEPPPSFRNSNSSQMEKWTQNWGTREPGTDHLKKRICFHWLNVGSLIILLPLTVMQICIKLEGRKTLESAIFAVFMKKINVLKEIFCTA